MEEGRIVVGAQGPGYLREVVSRTESGDVVRLETRQARLTEAMRAGELHLEMSMNPGAQATTVSRSRMSLPSDAVAGTRFRLSPTRVEEVAEGVQVRDGAIVFTHSFGNGDLSVDWTGEIDFDPRAEAHLAWNRFLGQEVSVDSLRVSVGGDVRMSAEAVATAEASAQFEDSVELASFGRDFVGSIGAVPVKGEVEMDVIAGLRSSAEAQASLATGEAVLTQSAAVTLRYTEEDQYGFEQQFSSDIQAPTPTFESSASVSARPYVITEVELTLYEVAGPRAGPMPYVEGEGVAHYDGSDHCEAHARVYAGIDGVAGVSWTSLGRAVKGLLDIPDVGRTFRGPREQVVDEEWPCTGSLSVVTETTGDDLDTEYTVTVDGEHTDTLATNDTTTFSDLSTGDHRVELGGIDGNCSVPGSNPRTVTVGNDAQTTTTYSVECDATTGSIEASVSTTGDDQDTDGYTVTVDDSASAAVGPNGSATFSGLAAGDHTVELSGIQSNCATDGTNPRTVTVQAGTTASAGFSVSCTALSGGGDSDGFEDGDFTDIWTVGRDDAYGSATVDQTRPRFGSYSYHVTVGSSYDAHFTIYNDFSAVQDTATFSAWVYPQGNGSGNAFHYELKSPDGSGVAAIRFGPWDDIRYATDQAGNGDDVNVLVANYANGQWYRVEMFVDAGAGTIDFRVRDRKGNSWSATAVPATVDFTRVRLSARDYNLNYEAWVDSVTYRP